MSAIAEARVLRRHAVLPRRRIADVLAAVVTGALTLGAIAVLLLVLGHVVAKGVPALTPSFFVEEPLPFGEIGGGVGPAILGTLVIGAIAAAAAVPIGLGSALFIVEYRSGRYAAVVRSAAETIAGLPSIVVGVFVWAFLVRGVVGHYAGVAGAAALAVIMIPIVARSVEEVLRLVPGSLREAALALGAPRWRMILRVVLPTARAGIATAVVLAVARAAGETAPLLLTTLGNVYASTDLFQPMAALPLQIYQYAVSPYDDWHAKAWGASLVLIAVIGVLSALLRIAVGRRPG